VKGKSRSILFNAKNWESPRRLAELQPETKIDKKNRQKKEEDNRGERVEGEVPRTEKEAYGKAGKGEIGKEFLARKRGRKRERYIWKYSSACIRAGKARRR
jgi:hypothetical protein